MAILDLGFSSESKKSTSDVTSTASGQTSATESQTGTSTGTQTQKQEASTRALDLDTQKLVKELIGGISSGILAGDQEQSQKLADTLFQRAQSAQDEILSQIQPIISGARLEGEQQLQALQAQLAQQSGGSVANTLVASATGVGRANLESQLAKASGELTLAAREAATRELSNALTGVNQAQGAPIADITNLLNVLKGADIQQIQSSQAESETTTALNRILETLTQSTQRQKSTTEGSGSSTGFKIGGSN